jgi:thiamine biosynthesis lipoprotein ApbE
MDLNGGGLATSSPRRSWPVGAGTAHHLFDPRTGAPAEVQLAGVTVLAGEAWWAEALTKAVLVGGLDPGSLGTQAASGVGVTFDGEVVGTDDLVALAVAP